MRWAAGIAIGEMTHTSANPWIILFTLAGVGLLFFRSFYKVLEKAMIALIILMLLSFITILVMVKPEIGKIITGLKPSLPIGALGLVTAFMASSVPIVWAFYQCYLV